MLFRPCEESSLTDLLSFVCFVLFCFATVWTSCEWHVAAVEGYPRKGQHPLRTFVTLILIPFIVFFGSFAIWTYMSEVALQEYVLITVRNEEKMRRLVVMLLVCYY
jgi:hypothetical protein